MIQLSVVSPVYQAELMLDELVARIENVVKQISVEYEIILVEDGSTDNSWQKIEGICTKNTRIIGVKLSRNFGQHYAITAGLDHTRGEWVVVMDCDLQDRPEEIPNLYNKAKEGFDIVLASRHQRKDNFFKKLFSMFFYRILGYLTGSNQDETIANFGVYNRNVIDAILSMRESIRYFPTMVKWVGFKSTKLEVEHAERTSGKTNYNLKKLLKLALDIILAYSDKPLRLMVKTGILITAFSFIIILVYLFRWLNGQVVVMGYTSLIVSIWFLSGVIISTLGIIGLYLGKTFEGVKSRPLYVVKKRTNYLSK